ncbi:MAG: hypothetical protein ACE5G1_08575 [bacterium]
MSSIIKSRLPTSISGPAFLTNALAHDHAQAGELFWVRAVGKFHRVRLAVLVAYAVMLSSCLACTVETDFL